MNCSCYRAEELFEHGRKIAVLEILCKIVTENEMHVGFTHKKA